MNLSFDLTSDLIESLQNLGNTYSNAYTLLKNLSTDELEALHKYARVSMVGASTRLENAQLTDSEINWLDTLLSEDGKVTAFDQKRELIENKFSKDRERIIEEVAGCRAMLLLIYESPQDFLPLKESDLRGLHFELMAPYREAIRYAGKYKTQTNSVIERNNQTGETRVVFQTADAGPITSTAMHDLVEWYNNVYPSSPWPVAVACELVCRFLAIHPFQDGNGRLGRGLFLMSLLQSRSETISYVSRFIAIDRYIEKHKEEYYLVLNRCSEGKFKMDSHKYKIHYFLKFMVKVLGEALEGINISRTKFLAERKLSEAALKVLLCFREFPEVRLNTSKISEEAGLPRRTVVYALNTLRDAGLIQRYGQGAGTRYQLTF